MYAFDLVKGFTKALLIDSQLLSIPDEIMEANSGLKAKEKFNLILRSNYFQAQF